MARLYRLFAPGAAFFGLGLVVLAVGTRPWFRLRGGLVVTGIYTLALQIAVSALLLAAIDDLSGGGPALTRHPVGHGAGGMLDISARPTSFQRALIEFYRWPFLPVLLLGFGVGGSLSALAVGSLEPAGSVRVHLVITFGTHLSEAVLGAMLVVVAVLLWWRGAGSYFGWVIGFGVATVLGQLVFLPGTTDLNTTLVGWGGFVAGLCVLRLLAYAAGRGKRKGA